MVSVNRSVGVVVTLFVAAILVATLMPTAIGAFAGAEETTATLDVGNSTELKPNMTATLDSVNSSNDFAEYTVEASGDTATVTVDNGTNETVTVDGADVTIAVTDVSTGQATATFEYPTTYGWGGAASLWGIMGVIVMLPVVLLFVAKATDAM